MNKWHPITFSIRYREYERSLREKQIVRAFRAIQKNPSKLERAHATAHRRLIVERHTTQDGELAEHATLTFDQKTMEREAAFDGFYAVCANLTDDACNLIRMNKRRWEIEKCFCIMKHEFKVCLVYPSLDGRIRVHFLMCFLTLLVYRKLEARLGQRFSYEELLGQLS